MKRLIRLSRYPLAILCVAMIINACSKTSSNKGNGNSTNPDSTAQVAANISLMTLSPWKYDTSGIATNNSDTINIGADTTVVPMCERGDVYTFLKDSTGSLTQGAQMCVPGSPQTEPFTWNFSSNGQTLYASFNPILQEGVTIITLDSTELSVYRDSTVDGITYRYIVTLTH
jgi:hypothetical protein